MAGRFVHFLVAGAAVFGGMIIQGDVDLEDELDDNARVERRVDRAVDRAVDRSIDRATVRVDVRGAKDRPAKGDEATERALAAAVAELIRAEASLVTTKMDDNIPDAVVEQAEQRRDIAKEAVDRLADDLKAQAREERDSGRRNVRDDVRDAIRG